MKGLLRGMVAVGLLAGGVLGVGCGDMGQSEGSNTQTPINQANKSPAAEASRPAGAQLPQAPGDTEDTWRERPGHSQTPKLFSEDLPGQEREVSMGGGTAAPAQQEPPVSPAYGGSGTTELPREELGLGLADSYQGAATPRQER
ncbi:hypothetical protein [Hyalangium rubrum]|uniref:Lipoprotein n=1 Tax=Hyalangium rubrum TaxID=3103134 RepID=A0ABU5H298_9BACT|nr:hypothetical protein [Hyalangium sp. s54d21]MDY7227554.1 hypothetical protein [Hyalangium sp. s54d21]